jgi:hypothetical protein
VTAALIFGVAATVVVDVDAIDPEVIVVVHSAVVKKMRKTSLKRSE